ncbi:Phage protein [Alloalcanivorax xenomutans]|uniref:phage neck terminator protein n=1 Tax=Alloalcanivorax xenomutans TaxID=1094342 RepID=UPI0006D5CA7E|nr:hypothetical protein [Alloalcanivorax xenomutans]CUR48492.1 Phage protein [Alloalcanivorax xenomutans]
MTSLDELNAVLHGLVVMITGIPANRVILANQRAPKPKGDSLYATYNPIPVRAYGHARRYYEEIPAIEDAAETGWKDLKQTVVTTLELMLSVNFYNTGSKDAAWRMQNASYLSPVSEYLFVNEIGWRTASPVRNLTAPQRAAYQSRHQLDVDLVVEGEQSATILAAAYGLVKIYDEDGNLISED